MYIKNRRNSTKIKGFGSYQTLYLTESSVLQNRPLFIYSPLGTIKLKENEKHINSICTFDIWLF